MKITGLFLCFIFIATFFAKAQLFGNKENLTHADTLRGSITPERAWWNVLRYDIQVQPDYDTKSIQGKTVITYKVVGDSYPAFMQVDLQQPLIMDSVLYNGNRSMSFKRDGNAWFVSAPKQKESSVSNIVVYYHGTPREAVNPPWDGGWIWKKDSLGRPWMSVACQGLGASVWYPCKDHQSDEPDSGASLTVIVPDTLIAVGNGRLVSKTDSDGLTTFKWEVKNPINNYDIVPYIGKYAHWSDTYDGKKGKLDLNYWVLDYNEERAKTEFEQVKSMLRCFEDWLGPYPFYEDGYKLVESPHLGMEHQSAVAYGNHFGNGYLGRDLSGTGWGLKWDYIIIHESAHEWFGNSITSNDIADMWVHEGFADYAETLYTECLFGKQAGNEYNYGQRKGIRNKAPIIGMYGVNKEGSGDMYPKGSNMLQTIRHIINDDDRWKAILNGLSSTFYHKTVDTKQVENYISKQSGIDLSKVFDQYLRHSEIPVLDYYFSDNKIFFQWDSCIAGFDMPIRINDSTGSKQLIHSLPANWQSITITSDPADLFDSDYIIHNYYIYLKQVQAKN